MQLIPDDPVNRSIWTESVALQRKITEREMLPLQVGAQQTMPKMCDQGLFSREHPLPWVPDLVGSRFASDRQSVLVVGSSYNGFIKGYSPRNAVLPLTDYADAKNAGVNGLDKFIARFKECVVDCDVDYYQPILSKLLTPGGCDLDCCCLTDLCKASFVERGNGPENGNRGDKGNDSVVKKYWPQWIPYVVGVSSYDGAVPLAYQWIWKRLQQCRVIVALGTIAEYGVLKIFQRMAIGPKVRSWEDSNVVPNHPTMTSSVSDWEYAYASARRKLRNWLITTDWWVLGDSGNTQPWFMLPVHHPASAIGRENDKNYDYTVQRLKRLLEESYRSNAVAKQPQNRDIRTCPW